MEKHKADRGSYTIEASMIFSLIVMTVILLLFTFSYMQQKSALESIASYAAQQGAELWLDSRRSMENGWIDVTKAADSPGYRVFDNLLLSRKTFEGSIEATKAINGKQRFVLSMDADSSLPGKKAFLIGEAICGKMRSAVIKPASTKVRITYSNGILRGKLTVEIIQEIKVPLGGLKQFLDGKETLTLSARSSAAVTEPDEYIRNIDFAVELAKKLEGELDLKGIIDRIKAGGNK